MPLLKFWNHFINPLGDKGKYKEIHIRISFNPFTGGSSFIIQAPVSDTFSIRVYDSSKTFLGELKANDGRVKVPDLPNGKYSFKVLDLNCSIIRKGKFNVTGEQTLMIN